MTGGLGDGTTALVLTALYGFGGLLVAAFLTYAYLRPNEIERICSAGCLTVQNSRWSRMGAVPVAAVGTVFYMVMVAESLMCLGLRRGRFRHALLACGTVTAAGAVLFSARQLFIQFFVLRAFCPLCALSAALCLFLAISLIIAWRRDRWSPRPLLAVALAVSLAGIAMLAALALAPPTGPVPLVLARVNGKLITTRDMERDDPPGFRRLSQELYVGQRDWLEDRIDDELFQQEAARRGMTVQKLLEVEVGRKIAPLLAAQNHWFKVKGIASTEPWQLDFEAKVQEQDMRSQRLLQFAAELRTRYPVQVYLQSPGGPVLAYDRALAHVRGWENAPIRLVVFSEFQCPNCADLACTLDRVLDRYPFQVNLTFLHMPMDFDALSEEAAEAAECAGEQGRFWQYHDRLMKEHKDGCSGLNSMWAGYADDVGLDKARFMECLKSGRMKGRVAACRAVGVAMGIQGVPALYLNGRKIGGALEFEQLSSIIDAEIKRLR